MHKSKCDFAAEIKKHWHGRSVILLIIAEKNNHEEIKTNSTPFFFLFYFNTVFICLNQILT